MSTLLSSVTRRGFLAAAGAAALSARSYSQVAGAGERLRIGVIGCGGQAMGHMRSLMRMRDSDNLQITAVCDIYDPRREEAAKLTEAKQYTDYRRVLDDKDVDYVLIATPDHWHYKMSLDAADARKAIYCEKPMTHTVDEARKLVAKVKQSGVKMQVGVQGMSDDSYEAARKYVEQGVLGRVVIAQIDYSRNHLKDFLSYAPDSDVQPGVNLDWKAWLGPAPKRPFSRERFFSWRQYWDYSGGIATDLFVHRVTRIIRSLGLDFPERGVGTGGKFEFTDSAAEVPDTFNVSLDYPGGPNVLLISSMANDTPVEHVLRGHKATLTFNRTGFVIKPQEQYAKEGKEIVFKKTGAEDVRLHHRNLAAAIRSGAALKCDCDLGFRGVVACNMGVESYRRKKYMRWDAGRQKIVEA